MAACSNACGIGTDSRQPDRSLPREDGFEKSSPDEKFSSQRLARKLS